jgi:hypothetical protein
MDVQTIQTSLEQALLEAGVIDSLVETIESGKGEITFFDVQRKNVNGEDLWFCFRVAVNTSTQVYTIVTREELDRDLNEIFSLGIISENFFSLWMKYYISDNAILEELTRP